jgi:hypothetical protein
MKQSQAMHLVVLSLYPNAQTIRKLGSIALPHSGSLITAEGLV